MAIFHSHFGVHIDRGPVLAVTHTSFAGGGCQPENARRLESSRFDGFRFHHHHRDLVAGDGGGGSGGVPVIYPNWLY